MWRTAHALFGFLDALSQISRRWFSRSGFLFLGTLVMAGTLGVDTTQTLAYQVFALLLGLLGVAVLACARPVPAFTAHRDLPLRVTVGEAFEYAVEVHLRSASPADGLALRDALRDPRPHLEAFLAGPGLPTYRRWKRLEQRALRLRVEESVGCEALPDGGVRFRLRAVALRRGHACLDQITLLRPEPLGLLRRPRNLSAPQRITVLPRRYAVAARALGGGRHYQPGGVSFATGVGDSLEFIGLREYRPGDPLQRVDWKAWARAGELVVKEYEDEFFFRQALVLDSCTDHPTDPSVEEAISVAASLLLAMDAPDSLVDLLFVAGTPHCLTLGRGQSPATAIADVLAGLEASPAADFEGLAQRVLARQALVSSCLLVLLDWDAPRQALVQRLRALGRPVWVLLVSAQAPPAPLPPWVLPLVPGAIAQGLARL